jgi:hypothetical protein
MEPSFFFYRHFTCEGSVWGSILCARMVFYPEMHSRLQSPKHLNVLRLIRTKPKMPKHFAILQKETARCQSEIYFSELATDRETLLREQTEGVSRETEISPNWTFSCHTHWIMSRVSPYKWLVREKVFKDTEQKLKVSVKRRAQWHYAHTHALLWGA